MPQRMNPIKNITRFTYEFTSFQGWRLSICRHHEHYTRYFSDREYGGEQEALEAALEERDRVYGYLEDFPFEPKKALEMCRGKKSASRYPLGLKPRKGRKYNE